MVNLSEERGEATPLELAVRDTAYQLYTLIEELHRPENREVLDSICDCNGFEIDFIAEDGDPVIEEGTVRIEFVPEKV
jgi:hypothetical protein